MLIKAPRILGSLMIRKKEINNVYIIQMESRLSTF